MDKLTQIIDWLAMTAGVLLGFLYGDITPLMYSLIAMVALDFITGLAAAAARKEVTSCKMFKGLIRKFLILVLVAVAHVIDCYVTNTYPVIQSAVMLFFIVNEALSIVENAAMLGLPIPKKLLDVLEDLQAESGSEGKTKIEEEIKEDGDNGS
ncbi:MAG: phage holin family protein [Ruminococcaceae bacterium]|nr:phage holin family protein [Oscillospiraceae bacterium]